MNVKDVCVKFVEVLNELILYCMPNEINPILPGGGGGGGIYAPPCINCHISLKVVILSHPNFFLVNQISLDTFSENFEKIRSKDAG